MDWFIMTVRDTSYHLVGPFPTMEAAGDWGRDEKNNPDDDPRWQTLQLEDPRNPPIVYAPKREGELSPAEILALPMDSNDANADTIREYLVALLMNVWVEADGFSGKRPFGNSGWYNELYRALVAGGAIKGKFDSYGVLTSYDEEAADRLIKSAIEALNA